MKIPANILLLSLYRVSGGLSTYLVNAYSTEDAIDKVYMHELDETWGNADYHAKRIDTTREGIVLDEVD